MNELKNMLAYTGINVERLVDDYTETLHTNNNPHATREASIIALKEFATNKEWLIRQVMAMPGYNGNLQSVKTVVIPNIITDSAVRSAVGEMWNILFDDGKAVLSKVDEEGKTIEDYIKEELSDMPGRIDINNLANYSGKETKKYSQFDANGYTNKSIADRYTCSRLMKLFATYKATRLTADMARTINDINPNIRAAENMKTTRAVGKIIKEYGLEDKAAGSLYTKTYITKYCEVMKENGICHPFVLSVNPIDYLKMSIGEFTSCHNINGGGWRSGCISYMLDKVTMIGYTVRANTEEEKARPELLKKVHRNCFHWDENHRLIQSRVYPQGNEGCTDLYAAFRHETQARISEANGWDKDAWVNRKRRYMEFTIAGEGSTNYADWSYEHFGGNLSTPGHSNDPYSREAFVIGAQPTCIVCGAHHTRSNYLNCRNCRFYY